MHVAVEFLDGKCMELVENHLGYRRPIQLSNFYTLVETSGSHEEHDKEVGRYVYSYRMAYCNYTLQKLTAFIEHLSAEGCIEDGTLASDLTKVCEFKVIIVNNNVSTCVGKSPLGHQRGDHRSPGP